MLFEAYCSCLVKNCIPKIRGTEKLWRMKNSFSATLISVLQGTTLSRLQHLFTVGWIIILYRYPRGCLLLTFMILQVFLQHRLNWHLRFWVKTIWWIAIKCRHFFHPWIIITDANFLVNHNFLAAQVQMLCIQIVGLWQNDKLRSWGRWTMLTCWGGIT